MIPSKDIKVKHVVKDLQAMKTEKEILEYIAGDAREDVIAMAKDRIAVLAESKPPAEGDQPMKQGRVEKVTQKPTPLPEFKMVRKEAKTSMITIRDGKAVTVEFDEEGKEIKG